MHRVFFSVATLVVAVAIVWGFYLVGSPASRRLDRFDEQRIQDLQTISQEIQLLTVDADKHDKPTRPLPKTLEEAASRAHYRRLSLQDPETGEPYGYRVTGEATYELSAKFARARASDYEVAWDHPAGEHWFQINVLDDNRGRVSSGLRVYDPVEPAPTVQGP